MDDIYEITKLIGLPEKLNLPNAKGNTRKDRRHYSLVLNDQARAIIERVCANEINTFCYQWENKI